MNYTEFVEYYIRRNIFLIYDIQDNAYNYAYETYLENQELDLGKIFFDNLCYNIFDEESLFHNKLYDAYYSEIDTISPKNSENWVKNCIIDVFKYAIDTFE